MKPQSVPSGLLRQVERGLLALNVLSLDAPLVALAWQDLAARQLGASLSLSQRVVLVLTTWLVYAGDRLLDARPDLARQSRLPRHRFAGRNRRKLMALWSVGGILDLLLVPLAMPVAAWPAAIGLGIALVTYLLACERFPRIARQLIPRETVVSLFFVAAAFFFPLAAQPPESWAGATPVILLASTLYALAFANCFAIACWESREDSRMGEQTLATICPNSEFCLRRLTEVLAATLVAAVLFAAFLYDAGNAAVLVFSIVSVMSLRLVNRYSRPLVRPPLADLCLLLPWLAVLSV